jgi:putative flavoprotein involved in K+ transport
MEVGRIHAVSDAERIETVVVAGGQAGLSVGYHLARRGLGFVILDANERIGDSWRKRWDSFRLFTPAPVKRARGMPFPGPAHSFSTKDEVADYLENYAAHFRLPVHTGVRVRRLSRKSTRFVVDAGPWLYEADNVVVAMGSYQLPRLPVFAGSLDPEILQLHAGAYRNVAQLREGRVLVVAVGNSGAEIVLDVADSHQTWLAATEFGQFLFSHDGALARHIFLPLMFRIIGHRILTVRTPVGRKMRPKLLSHAAPLVRVKPSDIAAAGIQRIGRVVGTRDGLPLLEDQRVLPVENVIWCTGFRPDFSWIDLPVFGGQDNEPKEPIHVRGIVANEPGLYFVGLAFLYAMSSGFLPGVGRDATHVVKHIASRKQPTSDAAGKTHIAATDEPQPSHPEGFPASRSCFGHARIVQHVRTSLRTAPVEIPASTEHSVSETVARHLESELGVRGLLLTAGDLARAEAEAAHAGAYLRTCVLRQRYPMICDGSGAVKFESEHTAARLDAALAFGAVTARVLAKRDVERVARSVEFLCAIFNLGIGLIDGLCDDDAETGVALLELIRGSDLANAAEVPRARGWLRTALPPTLAEDLTVTFTVDIVESFFETLHTVYPDDGSWQRRRRVGMQLGVALEAERGSVTRSAEQTPREELIECSRLTSVLPFQIIETLASGHRATEPTAGTRLGEAMWRIDDLVDLCQDVRRGSHNGVLLASATGVVRPGERDLLAALERLLNSTHIACAAADAADHLLAGLQVASDDHRGRASFLHFIQRYAGITPVTCYDSVTASDPAVSITSNSSSSSTDRSLTGGM